jgi:hypothetical protein
VQNSNLIAFRKKNPLSSNGLHKLSRQRGLIFTSAILGLSNDLGGQNRGACQTERRDGFPERPGCANKGIGLETDGKPCLNGRLLTCLTVWPVRRVVDAFPHVTSPRNLPDALRHPLHTPVECYRASDGRGQRTKRESLRYKNG